MLAPNSLTATQSMLMKAQCPGCSKRALELRMWCERGSGCEYRASCSECNLEFQVRTESQSSGLDSLLPHLICPCCSTLGAEYQIACTTTSRSCEKVVTCTECDYVFDVGSKRPEAAHGATNGDTATFAA